MRTAVLVSGVVLLGLAGGAAGYEVGRRTDSPTDDDPGTAVSVFPSPTPSPQYTLKTPEPNNLPALTTAGMTFDGHRFTVRQKPRSPVRVSIDVPDGWQLTTSPKTPGEVKFLDPLRERGVRVESGFAPGRSPGQLRDQLIGQLRSSVAPEDDLRLLDQSTSEVEGEDGAPRQTATLIYTYIPNKTRRYVIVRWVATEGDDRATVEMSITGLPQDADGLGAVLYEATKTVDLED